MLEAAPALRTIAIFEEMQPRHPELPKRGSPNDGAAHTAVRAPLKDPDVIFCQVQAPGRVGLIGFCRECDLVVRVAGVDLDDRPYHSRLACFGFEHGYVILGGESYTALAEGLQNALWALGGAPQTSQQQRLRGRRWNVRCEFA